MTPKTQSKMRVSNLSVYMGTPDKANERIRNIDRLAVMLGYAAPNGGLRGRSRLIQAIADGDITLTMTPSKLKG